MKQSNSPPPQQAILDAAIAKLADPMKSLLKQVIGFKSISGHEAPLTRFLADWARGKGFEVDLWQASEAELAVSYPVPPRHIPLAGRPTLVIRKKGRDPRARSLLFNAHADVVSAPDPGKWIADPWSGTEREGKIYGRGACDVKGPLISALWALSALDAVAPAGLDGDLLVEIIPGEEDCVGLGTLTSLARGHQADGVVVLEPTECLPRNASRGGCRFEIITHGTAVHGTVKWLGIDAICLMRKVLDALEHFEKQWQTLLPHPSFNGYPVLRPITVDSVHGGQWQGMVCDRCQCAGYLELLPGDDLLEWQNRFRDSLSDVLSGFRAVSSNAIEVLFSEQYDGHFTPPDSLICRLSEECVKVSEEEQKQWSGWRGFNSGCEAGLRWKLSGSPTLVWGPGSLAQAHARDEFIRFGEVHCSARQFARFAAQWCHCVKEE